MPQRGVTGSVSRRARYNGLENCGPLCPAVGMAEEPVLGANALLPLSLGLCISEERIPPPARSMCELPLQEQWGHQRATLLAVLHSEQMDM